MQEWLNRQGQFTICGARLGNHELDLLALRIKTYGTLDCRHLEVNVSVNPIGSLGPEKSARRQSPEQQHENARQWVESKFHIPGKQALKGPDQLTAIRTAGVTTFRLSDLGNPSGAFPTVLAAGQSLFSRISAGKSTSM